MDTRWKPGASANPAGRPKGARSKLGEDFLRALSEDFEVHGVAVLAEVRETKPADYLKVVASLLPKQVEVKEATMEDLNDAELTSIIDAVRTARQAASERREGSTH